MSAAPSQTLRVRASDGLGLHAEVAGPEGGPVVVFSCAFSTTHVNWHPQRSALAAAGFRVVLWDFRGHGLSDAPDDPGAYTMDQVVRDLGSLLDRVAPGEAAVLAGLSFGGLASLHFCVRHPERVRALILAASGPGFKNPEAAAEWQRRSERTARFIEEKGLDAFVSGKAAPTCIGRQPELPAAHAAAAAIAAQSPTGLAHFGRRVAALAPSVIDELSGIAQPALVVVGEEDPAYARAAEVMSSKLPNARFACIPGAGHILNIEAEARFNALVLEFLRGLAGHDQRLGAASGPVGATGRP